MVKTKYIIIAAGVVIIGILAAHSFFQSEEKKIRKQFKLLAEWVSKDPGENTFTMAHKVKSMGTLFAKSCGVKAHIDSFSGSYTPEEISSYAARGRSLFSKLSLKFYDLDINFQEERMVKVILTAQVRGKSNIGEYVDETHEVECVLRKIENKWLFSNVEVVEVLKK